MITVAMTSGSRDLPRTNGSFVVWSRSGPDRLTAAYRGSEYTFRGVIDLRAAVLDVLRGPSQANQERAAAATNFEAATAYTEEDTTSEPAQIPKLLVAEDNQVNQKLISKMLARLHWACDVAENGMAAVEKVERDTEGNYRAVLMDCQMPVMDGYEAARRLRAMNFTKPIFALTANVSEASKAEALSAGMDAFLSKPVQLPQLKQVLDSVLDGTVPIRKDFQPMG